MGTDNIDTPPSADSPLSGSGESLGWPDAGPQRDEATPETEGLGDLVRTNVNTEAEKVLRGGADPEALVSPPRDEEGHFADKPGQIYAEGLADAPWGKDSPLAVSPADEAATAQGDLSHYQGVDQWTNDLAREGSRVWFASHERPPGDGGPQGHERTEGKTGFGVPEGELHDGWQEVALSATRFNEGAQIEPYQGGYRGYLDCYEFTQDTPVATGMAAENTRYGDGGMAQMYVPDVKQLIADGKLQYVGTAQFEGATDASWRVRQQ
jgi:hypothetical protein